MGILPALVGIMYTPIMIFKKRSIATQAAVALRRDGNIARVVVDNPEQRNDRNPVFILQTPLGQKCTALETIDQVMNRFPELKNNVVRCPHCGSPHVEYPNEPEASPSMKAVAKLLEMIDRMFTKDGKSFHCLQCEHTWHDK